MCFAVNDLFRHFSLDYFFATGQPKEKRFIISFVSPVFPYIFVALFYPVHSYFVATVSHSSFQNNEK